MKELLVSFRNSLVLVNRYLHHIAPAVELNSATVADRPPSRDGHDVTDGNQTVSTKTLHSNRLSRHGLIGLVVGLIVPFLLVVGTVTSLVCIWRRRKC